MLTRIYNHGQIIWDEHLKTTFFKNISHILHKVDPLPQNNVDVQSGNNIVTGEREIRVYTCTSE